MELDAKIPDKRTPSSNLPDLNGLVSGLIVIYLLRHFPRWRKVILLGIG